jgi:hypothetical protein
MASEVTPEMRAENVVKYWAKRAYYHLIEFNKDMHEARKAGVNLGDITDFDPNTLIQEAKRIGDGGKPKQPQNVVVDVGF